MDLRPVESYVDFVSANLTMRQIKAVQQNVFKKFDKAGDWANGSFMESFLFFLQRMETSMESGSSIERDRR